MGPPPARPRRVAPRAALQDRVASIEIVEGGPAALTVLPNAAVVLGLQWRGRVRAPEGLLAQAGVTGLQEGARPYTYVDDAASVLVRFTPTGASCLGVPVAALTRRSVALEDLLPAPLVREVVERLAEAPDDDARVAIVEALLVGRPALADGGVRRAITIIHTHRASDGPLVRRLTTELGVSERQLERRFERVVGLTPMRYAALRRFERAAAALHTADTLGGLAIEAGYYDQAHLTREFRRYAGVPPGALRRSG